jgi:hypothetical protein
VTPEARVLWDEITDCTSCQDKFPLICGYHAAMAATLPPTAVA